jgi:protein-S-isoprenylcysteine O-methyltransferase Ste14
MPADATGQSRATSLARAYVLVQVACLVALTLSGQVVSRTPVALSVQVAGVILALWAITTLRIGHFNVTPTVVPGSPLVRRGPYRYIRHPMYAAQLIFFLPPILERLAPFQIVVWVALLIVLLAKLRFEEDQLAAHHPDFLAYRHSTWKLLPFIY